MTGEFGAPKKCKETFAFDAEYDQDLVLGQYETRNDCCEEYNTFCFLSSSTVRNEQ